MYASRYGASFVDKNSKKMNIDLREIVSDDFGFGDFIFRNPDTLEEVARVHNLKELQNVIFAIPKESLFTISVVITYPAGCILVPCFHLPSS